jgi:hydroxymethylpyrimidine pyrophosphatase-like HAD family hydrolase
MPSHTVGLPMCRNAGAATPHPRSPSSSHPTNGDRLALPAVTRQVEASASAARSQPYYLDVTHPDANKGTVATMLSKLLSVYASAIATIGDMPNDVLMFRKGGLSIAMGNASPQVQAQADLVTDSYGDEGFAKAMEGFILERRRS